MCISEVLFHAKFSFSAFQVLIDAMTLTTSRTRGTVNTLSKVLPAQLLSMRNQEEIMNLVLSHSRYDEDSDVTYNWAGIEQDIKLKYVGNKPLIATPLICQHTCTLMTSPSSIR